MRHLRAAAVTDTYRIVGDHVEPIHEPVLTGVHPADDCAGRPCVVHAPADHGMRSWPLRWCPDRGMFERLCEHRVGHPDPDQLVHWIVMLAEDEAAGRGVHGCDGCCVGAHRRLPRVVTADAASRPQTCPNGACPHTVYLHDIDETPERRERCTVQDCPCGRPT